jgi:CTP:molybdopterin cytidylyltransferase MocA
LHVGGRSLIRRAAQTALDAMAQKVIVVLGAHATSIQPELEGLNLTVVINPAWNTGMGSSVACGIDALLREMPDAKGVLLMLADQPGVTGLSLSKVWQACADDPCAAIAASRYGEVVGTPAFFGCDYFVDLLKLKGAQGARRLLKHYADDVRTVDLPEAAFDLDTPEDFAALRNTDLAQLPTLLTDLAPCVTRGLAHLQR